MAIRQEDDDRQHVVNFIAATIAFAEEMAAITAGFIESLPADVRPDQIAWPQSLLLEASAVAAVQVWDRRGIRAAIDPSLPSPQDAWRSVVHRLQADPESFFEGKVPLLAAVFRAWVKQYFENNCDSLRFTVVVIEDDIERLLDEMAHLLWNYRHVARTNQTTTALHR